MNMNDVQPTLPNLGEEVHQVLLGTVKAASKDKQAAQRIDAMKGVSRQEWKEAARALLLARNTSVLEALSTPCLEAIALAQIDVHSALLRGDEVAIEQDAERVTGEIAAKRWNVDLDDHGSTLHTLDTTSLNAALLDAFLSGAARRPAR